MDYITYFARWYLDKDLPNEYSRILKNGRHEDLTEEQYNKLTMGKKIPFGDSKSYEYYDEFSESRVRVFMKRIY